MSLADDFNAVAAELMALGGTSATLRKQNAAQGYDMTLMETTGAPADLPVTVVHMKATASRLSGFGQEINWDDKNRRLEFYYMKGADAALGDKLLVGSDTLTILALSKVDVQGTVIIYQLLVGL